MRSDAPLKIAVVGAGVAGLTAAHILQRRHKVTLYERDGRLGGHTNTVEVPDGPDAGTHVDTGFIVMNHRNYPLLTKLFEQLKVELRDSDMSFGYHDLPSGLQYTTRGGLKGLFAQRSNLVRPHFHQLISDVLRFYRIGQRDLQEGLPEEETLGDYLKRNGFGEYFIDHHLIPMGSAIWSTPCDEMLAFPAVSFLRFFNNHGLLDLKDRPQWRTVVGGSCRYIDRMRATWKDVDIRLNVRIRGLLRKESGVVVHSLDGTSEEFDHVVIATHADQALRLLEDPDEHERDNLGVWQYARSRTLLHTDESLMPSLRKVWSSWNFERIEGMRTALTYDMNRLQGLQTKSRMLVTLNPRVEPQGIIGEYMYEHPMFSSEAVQRRKALREHNGHRSTWFAGSYFGNGFHEDAVRSAVEVAKGFEMDL